MERVAERIANRGRIIVVATVEIFSTPEYLTSSYPALKGGKITFAFIFLACANKGA
jgi:hypothetical protein